MYALESPYTYFEAKEQFQGRDRRVGKRLGAQFRRPLSLVIEQ
jgi:hypothetical protein